MNIKLFYNNVDIYNSVSVCYLVHEMHAEKLADSLTIRLNDTNGIWSDWKPAVGDKLRLQCDSDDTGVMYLTSVNAENGVFTLRSLSYPVTDKIKKSRNWDGLGFLKLIAQIASEQNLSYKCYGVQEQIYKSLSQNDETNLEFLARLCRYEGCAFTIYNNTIVVYDEAYIESQDAENLVIGENGVFRYSSDIEEYTACTVVNGKITGTYGTGTALKTFAPATSNGEAERFAKGILRNCNKDKITGRITKSLCTQYSAASILKLDTQKASFWNRKVFVTKVRHDFLMNRSDIYFRGLLEGY